MPTNLQNIATERSIEEVEESMEQHDSRDMGREAGESEMELFARFQSGDNEAFLELFDRHANRIGRYCYRIVGDHDRAQDIVQDVWEKLVRYRDNKEAAIRNPLGLIYTMARNLCLNHIRNRRGHIPLHALDEEDHPLYEHRELSRYEEMAIIALERLPLPLREILILNAYSDYSFEEIARMIGETAGAVRTKAYRARLQLRRVIAALIEFDENYTGPDK